MLRWWAEHPVVRWVVYLALTVIIGLGVARLSGDEGGPTTEQVLVRAEVTWEALPQACREYVTRMVAVRSGKLTEAKAEQTARAGCREARPTLVATLAAAAR